MSEKTCNCDPCLEWLVPHDAEVTAIERERVISIIEKQDWNAHYWDKEQNTANCKCRNCEDVRELIRLIS